MKESEAPLYHSTTTKSRALWTLGCFGNLNLLFSALDESKPFEWWCCVSDHNNMPPLWLSQTAGLYYCAVLYQQIKQ